MEEFIFNLLREIELDIEYINLCQKYCNFNERQILRESKLNRL